MKAQDETKEALRKELERMRQKIAALERLEADRRRAEQALEQADERLQRALTAGGCGLWEYNIQTGEALFSRQRAEMLGYSLEELEPHVSAWGRLVHPEDIPQVAEALNEHLNGRSDHYESRHRLLCKSGEWKWILARGRVVEFDKDGKPLRFVGTSLDITRQKELEEQLIAEREKLRRIFRLNPAVIYTAKPCHDYGLTFISDNISAQLGYEPNEFLDDSSFWMSHIHPEDAQGVLQRLSTLSEQGHHVCEYRFAHKDGGYRWIRDEINLIRDEKGTPIEVMGYRIDIADRMQAEVALRKAHGELESRVRRRTAELTKANEELKREIAERERAEKALALEREQLLSIFDSINGVISVIDAETYEIVYANKFMKDRYGEDLIGRVCYQKLHGFDSPCSHCTKEIAIKLQGQPYRWDYHNPTTNKDYLATDRIIRWNDGRDAKFHLGIDVTERKRSEQALLESERRFREVLERVDLLAATIDDKGTAVFCNDFLLALTGWRRDEVLGKNWFDLFVSVENREARREAHFDYMRQGTIPVHRENEIIIRTGVPRLVKWTNTLLRGLDGKVIGTTGLGEDITDRKRAEQLLIQAERQKAIGDLAGGVAHNFNNLLQMLMGGIDLALIDLDMGNLTQSKNTLEQVLESAKFGAETVRRLQSFAQVRVAVPPSDGEVFDLSAAVRQATEMTKPLWKTGPEKAGIQIALNSDLAERCLVKGNESEIFEVLVNLVKNATEASPRGGNIGIKTFVEDDHVILQVMDDGMGIRREYQKKVFEPFWSTKGVSAGTGMGLAVSHGIISRHGGSISVESEERKGATFTIRLPLAIESTEIGKPSGEEIFRSKLNVLLIDDMAPIVMLVEEILAKHYQTVFSATTGEDALEIFRNSKIDLVISDLGMPGMNGWEVGKALWTICQEKGIPKTPFILLTGWGGQSLEHEKIIESGVDAVVEKPLDSKRLIATMREVVERAQKG